MTGFGSSRGEKDGHSISVDIKCLNSKFMDIIMRLPKEIQDKEAEVRKMATDMMIRGKVQINLELKMSSVISESDIIDQALFEKYYSSLDSLANKHHAEKSDIFRLALQMPNVIKNGDDKISDDIWTWVKDHLQDALEKADAFRIDEGNSLMVQLSESLHQLNLALLNVEKLDLDRRANMSKKLHDSLQELREKVRIDENRFEQELIYYLEKIDISEEKVRLKTHLDYFEETLRDKDSNGKRLQFISQEIGREINTIGSKANNAPLQKVVVGMKDELEKIKEQCLNLL